MSSPSATASSSSPAPWPSATPLIAALSRATSTATGSMSVAMQRARGHSCQRGEGEDAGAGADVGDIGEARALALHPVERVEAAGGGRVLAGAEGEAGVDLEIDCVGVRRRWVGVWTKKRPARIGSSPRWLIVTQSSSPSALDRGLAASERAQQGEILGFGPTLEISVDHPLVGPGSIGFVGDQHRRFVAFGKGVGSGPDPLALLAGAGNRNPEAHSSLSRLRERAGVRGFGEFA